MRKTIIAGNWKMYKTIGEAIELASGLKRALFDLAPDNIEIVLCPPFTALSEVGEIIFESSLQLGAQNAHWQDEGAFTGEVSCEMLKDAGCKFVIIGHSERRQYFGETNESVNNKLKAALKHSLTPIFCVGETLRERESGKTYDVLAEQINSGLKGLNTEELTKLVLAYEPVWAIGTGKTASAQTAQDAHKFIRDLLVKLFNKETAEAVRIQYGGSVKPENILELMQQPDIDGALVGGASLMVESFSDIVKKTSEVKK